MTFPLLPALHVERGAVREAPKEDPAPFLSAVARKHGELVVVDLDGLRANAPSLEVLQGAARNRVLWADAGSRSVADVSDLFIAGATRVTARWNTLADSTELAEAAEVAEAFYLGVEVAASFVENPRDRLALSKLGSTAVSLGVPVVIIDLAPRNGAPSDRAVQAASSFLGTTERWYMGAVRRDAAEQLREAGFDGAILPLAELQEGGP